MKKIKEYFFSIVVSAFCFLANTNVYCNHTVTIGDKITQERFTLGSDHNITDLGSGQYQATFLVENCNYPLHRFKMFDVDSNDYTSPPKIATDCTCNENSNANCRQIIIGNYNPLANYVAYVVFATDPEDPKKDITVKDYAPEFKMNLGDYEGKEGSRRLTLINLRDQDITIKNIENDNGDRLDLNPIPITVKAKSTQEIILTPKVCHEKDINTKNDKTLAVKITYTIGDSQEITSLVKLTFWCMDTTYQNINDYVSSLKLGGMGLSLVAQGKAYVTDTLVGIPIVKQKYDVGNNRYEIIDFGVGKYQIEFTTHRKDMQEYVAIEFHDIAAGKSNAVLAEKTRVNSQCDGPTCLTAVIGQFQKKINLHNQYSFIIKKPNEEKEILRGVTPDLNVRYDIDEVTSKKILVLQNVSGKVLENLKIVPRTPSNSDRLADFQPKPKDYQQRQDGTTRLGINEAFSNIVRGDECTSKDDNEPQIRPIYIDVSYNTGNEEKHIEIVLSIFCKKEDIQDLINNSRLVYDTGNIVDQWSKYPLIKSHIIPYITPTLIGAGAYSLGLVSATGAIPVTLAVGATIYYYDIGNYAYDNWDQNVVRVVVIPVAILGSGLVMYNLYKIYRWIRR